MEMKTKSASATFTRPNDTTQYAANDVMTADPAAVMTFSGLPSRTTTGCLIQSATIVSSANKGTKLDADLLLFSSTISDLDADNAAFTPTDAQLLTIVGVIPFATANWKAGDASADAAGNAFCVNANLGISIAHQTLYGVLIARNTYTPVANEVFTIKLQVIQKY